MKKGFRKASKFGFTLVEVLITMIVLSIFLTGAYRLFHSGQRASGKAAWLQYTVTDLRNAEQAITKALQATSYPSTLTPSRIFDAGGTPDLPSGNSANYYVHIPCGTGQKTAANIISAGGICLYMVKSVAEQQGFGSEDRKGELFWNVFRMVPCPEKIGLGQLILEERTASFSTTAPLFAAGLTVELASGSVSRSRVLVRNVDLVTINAGSLSHQPAKITVTIRCSYPREANLFREGTSAAIPNVGTVEAP